MKCKNVFKTSYFYLLSIILTLSSLIITLIITIKLYIWDKGVQYEDKSSINYLFIENHSFLMTAVLILIGLSLLVPQICSLCEMNRVYIGIIHGLINGVALILSLAPIFTLFTGLWGSKIAQHFYSIHCWFGGIAILLCIVQFFAAIIYYLISWAYKQSKWKIQKFQVFHRNIGHTVFGLICLSFILGISENNSIYVHEFPDEYDQSIFYPNVLALSAVFFCTAILYLVFSQTKLETAMQTIRTERMNEKQRFAKRVVEKQKKTKKNSQ